MEQEISIEQLAAIRDKLRAKQNAKRYEHTLGVAYTAACMAFATEIPPLKAELAGLLHDCAKCYTAEELIAMCCRDKVELSDEELAAPAVIHAKYGSFVAAHEYGISDPDILNAIRFHTTGRPDMSTLEKIIYAADYTEPLRYKADNLKEARSLAFTDLDECVYNILEASVEYLRKTNRPVVSDTMKAYEWYRKHRKVKRTEHEQ